MATHIHETAITIDHEDGTCRVDTTKRGLATTLTRAGFKELGDSRSLPYRRFLGNADQVRFRKGKSQRPNLKGKPFPGRSSSQAKPGVNFDAGE